MAEMILNRLAEIQFNTFLNVPIYLDIYLISDDVHFVLNLLEVLHSAKKCYPVNDTQPNVIHIYVLSTEIFQGYYF